MGCQHVVHPHNVVIYFISVDMARVIQVPTSNASQVEYPHYQGLQFQIRILVDSMVSSLIIMNGGFASLRTW